MRRLRDHVSFEGDFDRDRAGGFPPGRDLTTSLRVGLTNRGWGCGDARGLGHAWEFDCRRGRGRARVLVGYVADQEREWLVVAAPVRGLRRLLGRSSPHELPPLCSAIHDVLMADPRVRTIQWFAEDEWNDPSSPSGAPAPL